MLSAQNNNKLKLVIQYGLLSVVLWAIYQLPAWQLVDDQYNDYWRRHIAENSQPDDQILIIEIDETSLNEMESEIGRWPWPRSVHGFLVEDLVRVKSKAVVFDILFAERDIYRDDDDFFAQSVHQQKNIFYAATLLQTQSPHGAISFANLPNDFFVEVKETEHPPPAGHFILPWILDPSDWNIGLINFLADSDGIARRYPVRTMVQGWKLHSLPSRVVKHVNSKSNLDSDITAPDLINLKYKSLDKVFNSISYSEARMLLRHGQQLDLFRDKIVIIGATATGLHDLRPTPMHQLHPATTIIATAIDNLLNNDYLIQVNRHYGIATIFLLVTLLVIVVRYFNNYRTQLLLSFGLLVLALSGLNLLSYQLSKSDMLFPAASVFLILLASIFTMVIYRGFNEYLKRRHTLQTFSRFMDPVVVKQLIADDDWQKKLAHKSSEVSVLFSDIRGFTSLSEKRSAKEIMQILNDYFDLQVESIFNNKGTLDKFIGDAVMAFWGAPLEDKFHAVRAVETALAMVDNLLEFRDTLPVELQGFDVGIGVHSGEAVVGMLGSAKRFDYTAIGDTVNLASRIEGVTKGLARVLVSETTKEQCGGAFQFEYKGEFAVKGREEKVKLYEPSRPSVSG